MTLRIVPVLRELTVLGTHNYPRITIQCAQCQPWRGWPQEAVDRHRGDTKSNFSKYWKMYAFLVFWLFIIAHLISFAGHKKMNNCLVDAYIIETRQACLYSRGLWGTWTPPLFRKNLWLCSTATAGRQRRDSSAEIKGGSQCRGKPSLRPWPSCSHHTLATDNVGANAQGHDCGQTTSSLGYPLLLEVTLSFQWLILWFSKWANSVTFMSKASSRECILDP